METATPELLIKPRGGWEGIHPREIWAFRELFGFLIWRDIKIRYKQTLLGGLWAVLQPLAGMLIFAELMRRVAAPRTGGPPYPLFVYTGLVLWTFFANAVGMAGNSMIGSEQLIRKVYFPRVLAPLAAIAALGLDLAIGTGFMALLLLWYHWPLNATVALLPLFAGGTFLTAAGLGMFLAALNVQFRDVKYAVPYCLQMGLFVTPVIYPLSGVGGRLRGVLAMNPVAGMVEGWRAAILGQPIAWGMVCLSLAAGAALFWGGLMYFHRMERMFADVI
jgi:lipopolysaccharide transport system permease protein